jgi:hypothetical protein
VEEVQVDPHDLPGLAVKRRRMEFAYASFSLLDADFLTIVSLLAWPVVALCVFELVECPIAVEAHIQATDCPIFP